MGGSDEPYSLGWAYYKGKNYIEAEKFLQQAVEIMPLDPIINDHYADTLWMLKKDIQIVGEKVCKLKLKKSEHFPLNIISTNRYCQKEN